jgi:predicted MPP superfamily phosphohydrolase
MLRVVFFVLLTLALLGDARMFLFVMNRLVFGDHREERSPYSWMLKAVPLLLFVLTTLFWPLNRVVDDLMETRLVSRIAPARLEAIDWNARLAHIGVIWLVIAASVGVYWIIERIRAMNDDGRVEGTRTLPSHVVSLRRAHIPIAALRKLGLHNDLYDIEITRHELFIPDLDEAFDGYRIAFLTDTHVASFVRRQFYKTIHERVQAFDPDAIFLGGDFVSFNRHIALLEQVMIAPLRARDGIFAVLGNHDYWAGGRQVADVLTDHGVQIVINRSVMLRRGSATLPVVGIDEVYRGTPDVNAAFEGVDPSRPCLGLSHHPDIIGKLRGRRIDLLVCGHTHGGQIRLPFFGALVVPSKYEGRYAAGFHRVKDVLMYVSRGIGAIPPIRILCKPEVATFVLRRSRR